MNLIRPIRTPDKELIEELYNIICTTLYSSD